MKKGRFYKSGFSGVIVVCTGKGSDSVVFKGIVVGGDKYPIGKKSRTWIRNSFHKIKMKEK